MACTTLLVGKNASYDGSTMIARNDDSGSGHFTAKKFVVVQPEEHPAVYRSVLSHVEIPLPGDPMRMTAMPNALHPHRPRGRGAAGQAAGDLRYLRDERHCIPGRERDLVAGDHRRPSLDGTPCAR